MTICENFGLWFLLLTGLIKFRPRGNRIYITSRDRDWCSGFLSKVLSGGLASFLPFSLVLTAQPKF